MFFFPPSPAAQDHNVSRPQPKKELPIAAPQVISILLKVEPARCSSPLAAVLLKRLVPTGQRPKSQERSGGLYVLLLILLPFLLPGSSWYP